MSSAAPAAEARPPLVLSSTANGVTTLTMNNPKKLNAWTQPMLETLFAEMSKAAADNSVGAVVLTGSGKFYCAGVDLAAILKPMMPKTLYNIIVSQNERVFDTFITFPKPIVIAANGPAVGASVTTATLCDAIVAVPEATFSTPFAALGLVPEGCSSVHFAKIMGEEAAQRMLGDEGWKPTAAEAHAAGWVHSVVDDAEALVPAAQALAESWAAEGKQRSLVEQGLVQEYQRVNAAESIALATAFFSEPFLRAQMAFAESRGKTQPAAFFKMLIATRPVWSKLL